MNHVTELLGYANTVNVGKAMCAHGGRMMEDKIILEINGQRMDTSTYEVIQFLNGKEIKIKAVYHDAAGYPEEKE